MRALLVTLVSTSALAQPIFVADFEGPTSTDGGSGWTSFFPGMASREITQSWAHRGDAGLRIRRMAGTAGPPDTDTQYEVSLAGVSGAGEEWARWWMRAIPIVVQPQMAMNFGDTLAGVHVGLSYDPTGYFLVGYEGAAQTFFADRVANLPDAGWHLYELGLLSKGAVDAGYLFFIDGELAATRKTDFGYRDAGVHQLNIGMTYGDLRFAGAFDYDDVRTSKTRPAGRWRLRNPNVAMPTVGQCFGLFLGATTSDGLEDRTTDVEHRVIVSGPVLASGGATCSTQSAEIVVPARSMSVTVQVVATQPGIITITASDPDLLPGTLQVVILGAAGDGGVDGGPSDGGGDAGTDAGLFDAGSMDGAVLDAGLFDAGSAAGESDAGPSDAGASDAAVPDAGAPTRSELRVGCDCQSGPGAVLLVTVLALTGRRTRRAQARARRRSASARPAPRIAHSSPSCAPVESRPRKS